MRNKLATDKKKNKDLSITIVFITTGKNSTKSSANKLKILTSVSFVHKHYVNKTSKARSDLNWAMEK